LTDTVDIPELVAALTSLNASDNRQLPAKFVTKREARRQGWHPGRDLWSVPALKGKSIGGDHFQNREARLPATGRRWREADLDYHGGRRGAKRLLYADDGMRVITLDHYRTFLPIPQCE
jgi:hypothetical protein